jgi:hypothetical protein
MAFGGSIIAALSRSLFRFSPAGHYEEICQLDSRYRVFCMDGDAITSPGELISITEGIIASLARRLKVPQTDYPDKKAE